MTTTPKRCRSGQRCQPVTLKEALDCLAHHGALTVRELAERLGHISERTLGKQLSLHDDKNYPTLRQVIPLTLASESDALVAYLAEAVGGVFVRVPTGLASGDTAAVARIVREFGELLEAVAQSTADGRVTSDELARVEQEWRDVVTAGSTYVEQLRQVVTPAIRRTA